MNNEVIHNEKVIQGNEMKKSRIINNYKLK